MIYLYDNLNFSWYFANTVYCCGTEGWGSAVVARASERLTLCPLLSGAALFGSSHPGYLLKVVNVIARGWFWRRLARTNEWDFQKVLGCVCAW